MTGSFFLISYICPFLIFFFAIKARVIFELYYNRDYNLLHKQKNIYIEYTIYRKNA